MPSFSDSSLSPTASTPSLLTSFSLTPETMHVTTTGRAVAVDIVVPDSAFAAVVAVLIPSSCCFRT
jgi:hypothetical protein